MKIIRFCVFIIVAMVCNCVLAQSKVAEMCYDNYPDTFDDIKTWTNKVDNHIKIKVDCEFILSNSGNDWGIYFIANNRATIKLIAKEGYSITDVALDIDDYVLVKDECTSGVTDSPVSFTGNA